MFYDSILNNKIINYITTNFKKIYIIYNYTFFFLSYYVHVPDSH